MQKPLFRSVLPRRKVTKFCLRESFEAIVCALTHYLKRGEFVYYEVAFGCYSLSVTHHLDVTLLKQGNNQESV